MHSSYPHPVLGHEDDITSGQFRIRCTRGPVMGLDWTELTVFSELTNSSILELVEKKQARYVVEISCKQTYYKLVTSSTDPSFDIKILSRELRGSVNVKGWIVANKLVDGFQPNGMNTDYGNNSFTVNVGDILAEDAGFWFIADKEFDALKAPVSSFIVVGPSLNETGPMEVNWGNNQGDNKIIINLCKKDFDHYKAIALDRDAKKIIHSAIVLPVLVQGVVGIIEGEGSDYFNPRLNAVINAKARTGQIDSLDDEPIAIAQELLKNPIDRSLSGAFATLSQPEDEDYE